jgi:excinuclease UvrABC ATPase subunit
MFTIIEDCSPYYIRFTHEGAEKVPNECVKFVSGYEFQKKFTHYKYPIDQANQILDNTHMKNLFNFDIGRVSLFVTQPGFYYRPHKDGPNHRFSINYTVKILDNNCETSWYSDEELKDYIYNILCEDCAPDRLAHSYAMAFLQDVNWSEIASHVYYVEAKEQL